MDPGTRETGRGGPRGGDLSRIAFPPPLVASRKPESSRGVGLFGGFYSPVSNPQPV